MIGFTTHEGTGRVSMKVFQALKTPPPPPDNAPCEEGATAGRPVVGSMATVSGGLKPRAAEGRDDEPSTRLEFASATGL